MNEQRIGSTLVHGDASALIVYCPALRTAAPALMLALFGVACSIIAFASFAGLVGHSGESASSMLALAFAGVFVLPLLGVGAVFIAIALWSALNALTVATAAGELRADRRWCGIPLAKNIVQVKLISAIDSVREARFVGIFGGARYYRLLARTPAGSILLADHLKAAEETEQIRQLFIAAIARPELADSGKCAHRTDAAEPASAN